MPNRLSRTKGVAEKVKRLDRKVATPVRILTIDELRLRGMKNQPTGPEADLQGPRGTLPRGRGDVCRLWFSPALSG
jgi:hypothetical protein